METYFNLPMNFDFVSSILLILLSIFGLLFYKNKKDKFFFLAVLLVQLVFIGVLFDIIKHYPNILTVLSSISVVLIIIFLLLKDDKVFTYISFAIHFVSLFQLLFVLNLIR
ncbi:MAG TPA: hypothetical protein PK520_03475 [Exilispira sp.]|nr:hypothetical protein [Exilispira sp.]HQM89452.1 hypothetical protein [Exilispira sp.]HQQ19132.1 hypothetical protein [Exilispira sp.]